MNSRRQLSNRAAAMFGFVPESYHNSPSAIGPGDVVAVEIAQQDSPDDERFEAEVMAIQIDAAGFDARLWRLDTGSEISVAIRRQGPPRCGVVAFEVLHHADRPEPCRERKRRDYSPLEDSLVPVDPPQRCVGCGHVHDWIPIDGLPCMACRLKAGQFQYRQSG